MQSSDNFSDPECKSLLEDFWTKKKHSEAFPTEANKKVKENWIKIHVIKYIFNIKDISKDLGIFIPPRPPIIKGWLSKAGPFLLNMKRRFFVLDPHEGTFIRYKYEKDYPFKPMWVISLNREI